MRRVFIKKFFSYFAWAIFIGLITYLGNKYRAYLLEIEVTTTFFILFSIIFPIIIGASLKLPNLMVEIKQDKEWIFDWIKFMAILLPYLYIMLVLFLSYYPSGKGVISVPDIIKSGGSLIQIIAGVVLGYTLLDSLKKHNS